MLDETDVGPIALQGLRFMQTMMPALIFVWLGFLVCFFLFVVFTSVCCNGTCRGPRPESARVAAEEQHPAGVAGRLPADALHRYR